MSGLIETVAKALVPDAWYVRDNGLPGLVLWEEERARAMSLAKIAVEIAFPWERIESAPRDGTHILIAFGEDGVSTAAYHRDDDDLYPWKFMDSQGQGLPFFNGARDDEYGPTHWMPIPKFQRP
jgi:hypothetical protein